MAEVPGVHSYFSHYYDFISSLFRIKPSFPLQLRFGLEHSLGSTSKVKAQKEMTWPPQDRR